MKATAIAPSNIAFIKYWGKKDENLRLPLNTSISVNLSGLSTTTTVEFQKNLKSDDILLNGKRDEISNIRVIKQLDRVRKLAKINLKAKVVSQNNFPTASGLASSASGFAALTLAATKAAGLELVEKELSILARLGSGSACRSIPDGFVEWLEGNTSETSYAVSIFPPNYFDIAVIVVVISWEKKDIGSTKGHKRMFSNPFLKTRLSRMKEKISLIKKFIRKRNFTKFGELTEAEALELHAMTLTSNPPILYWLPETVRIIRLVWQLRKAGVPVYFTIDAGPQVMLICERKNLGTLKSELNKFGINKFTVNFPSVGIRSLEKHLF